ncbi:uncharacterized protein EDB91DRAFT_399747 [Suillus paluster]|uniref:uncharacterized protein n=1 Tax=Suillus paluster TaxID=48578 RepID=UPI001B868E02|nr:uncharacterized protein EDB91DRAFT_399747 [Suillus paluster]KAG1719729.1 hypothetical protein EDB91DRAFT_399747 [Suillus paluster]
MTDSTACSCCVVHIWRSLSCFPPVDPGPRSFHRISLAHHSGAWVTRACCGFFSLITHQDFTGTAVFLDGLYIFYSRISVCIWPVANQMSTFVLDPRNDPVTVFGEEPSHQVHPQDLGETRLMFSEMLQVAINTILVTLYFVMILLSRFATRSAPDPLDDTLPPLSEEPSHPELPQDPEDTLLSGMRQVTITSM